ncbi:hypothetical protein M4D55_25130 [Metabacillus idriensis]|uniref:hypothetical protein n=1 Tax=Metabacillus idriensis TaxID=324768 RepID=UPI00174D7D3A|nr:hypothetical protein [Metabacillus idriensis]MCM3599025.1 hypothetical protein [Metabacillus idriensis]
MRSLKLIIFIFIGLMFLTGCTEEAKGNAAFKERLNELESNPEEAENNFITTTIESSRELKTDVEDLKLLIDDKLNETDEYAGLTPTISIQLKNNDFTIQKDYLTDEQKQKYSKTIEFYSQGMDELHAITQDYRDAAEIYDKRALQEIKDRIDPAMSLVNKGIEQLEIERYE